MRLPLTLCLALTLAACAAPAPQQKGFGFGPISGAGLNHTQPMQPSPSFAPSYAPAPIQSQLPLGLHQTATGVPHFVAQSISARRGRPALPASLAQRDAMSIASSKWRAPYAAPVQVGGNRAMFRITTIDGHSFGVMRRMKTGFWANMSEKRKAYLDLVEAGVRQSGCVSTGPALVRESTSGDNAVAMPVSC